ncbi:MAG: type II toxin-antitoxin system HicB family antitoxin [Candidatus Hydrogenedentota bacterium]
MQILIRMEIFKEGDEYISLCPELNISSFGSSIEEAKKSLKEAVDLFLEECEKMGTLVTVLEEAGFTYIQKPVPQWVSPQPIDIEFLPVELSYAV